MAITFSYSINIKFTIVHLTSCNLLFVCELFNLEKNRLKNEIIKLEFNLNFLDDARARVDLDQAFSTGGACATCGVCHGGQSEWGAVFATNKKN